MCLAIPGKVIKINKKKATIKQDGHSHVVDFSLVPELKVGDWVMCSHDMVVGQLSKKEAEEKINIIRQLNK